MVCLQDCHQIDARFRPGTRCRSAQVVVDGHGNAFPSPHPPADGLWSAAQNAWSSSDCSRSLRRNHPALRNTHATLAGLASPRFGNLRSDPSPGASIS